MKWPWRSRKQSVHSAFHHNIIIVQIGILGLAFILVLACARVQIIQRDAYIHRPYIDLKTIERIDQMVKSGMIFVNDDNTIHINMKALKQRGYSKYTTQRYIDLTSMMILDNGKPILPEQAVSIHYPGNTKLQQRRGAILDRHFEPLATGPARHRQYPHGSMMFPVTGAIHPVYRSIGMENVLDDLLTGSKPVGISAHFKRFLYGKGTPPPDVVLSIDSGLQQVAYDALENYKGSAVVIDIETGDILAAVSRPAFDPSNPSNTNWSQSHNTELAHNRCWNRRYAPGSTFKIVTAAALLESDSLDGNMHYNCKGEHEETGVDEHDKHAHGDMTVDSAIKVSCNVFFCEAALQLKSELKTMAESFGFNKRLSILPPELSDFDHRLSILPSRIFELEEIVKARNPETGRIYGRKRFTEYSSQDYDRNRGTTGRTGFGQGTVEATPLQIAMVASVIANGGILKEPRVVMGTVANGQGTVASDQLPVLSKKFGTYEERRILSRKTAKRIGAAMETVMCGAGGTGTGLKRLYRHPERGVILRHGISWDQCIHVAGKTGTAQVDGKPDHSWFMSFAPVEKPKYAVAVICENAGYGSAHAGPVVMKMYEYLFGSEF